MQTSMQTHFDGGIGLDLCNEIKARGIQHFRLSGLNQSLDTCQEMLAEADQTKVNHLLIIDSLSTLEHLHTRNIEWQNEPDGDGRPVYDYGSFMEAYKICRANGNRLHGPTISNLDRDSLNWLKGFMRNNVPKDIVITYHHYTPDVYYWQAHKGYASRQEELDELKRIANGRRIACSESGYNDSDEQRQASNIKLELQLARENDLDFWTYYQINDGVKDGVTTSHFGARRVDYSWKPVAYVFNGVKTR